MKRYIKSTDVPMRTQQIDPGSLYGGQKVKDMSDSEVQTVDHVDSLGKGRYEVFFTDGSSGIYDSNDKFQLL